jgi:hypothetical protein
MTHFYLLLYYYYCHYYYQYQKAPYIDKKQTNKIPEKVAKLKKRKKAITVHMPYIYILMIRTKYYE